jgi:hypothetical protein
MKIQCKNCGVYFSIDQQDVITSPGLCDKCLYSLPKEVEFVEEEKAEVVTPTQEEVFEEIENPQPEMAEEEPEE